VLQSAKKNTEQCKDPDYCLYDREADRVTWFAGGGAHEATCRKIATQKVAASQFSFSLSMP
jgi:hypothetical protein